MAFLTTVWSNWLFILRYKTIFDAFRLFEKSCDNIAQLEWLIVRAIRNGKGRKSQERADLANSCEFNRRYLTCQICNKRFKIWLKPVTHLAISYADHSDWRIKSLDVLPVLIIFWIFYCSHFVALLSIGIFTDKLCRLKLYATALCVCFLKISL